MSRISFHVERSGGAYPLNEIEQRFRTNGFVILRDFLPVESRDPLREICLRKLADAESTGGVLRLPEYPRAEFLLGDVLAVRELERFDFIFFRNELLDILRHLFHSQELFYFGDSSIQFGEGARGFHKDNVERYDGTHDDWKGEYGLIRCGLYMQDHLRHSGGLKIRLASHNIATHLRGPIVDVPSRFGDLVFWNMRLTHSGNVRKLRFLPSLQLHPRIETKLPPSWTVPEQMRRISAFCAFARPGSHFDNYVEKMNRRVADYKPYLLRARKADEASAIVAARGVSFRKINDYFGELD